MKENILNNQEIKFRALKSTFIKMLFVSIFIIFSACKVKKHLVVNQIKKHDTVLVVNSKIPQIQSAQNQFDTFIGKAHAKLKMDNDNYDVTFNIKIKSNEKIWISVTAIAGIEAARILITPDSIWIINRLQGVYFKKPFSYLQTIAGNDINFKAISSVLIGNAIGELLNEKAAVATRGDTTLLTGSLNSVDYSFQANKNLMALQTVLTNLNKGQELQITNSGQFQVGDKSIPAQIDIKALTSIKKIQLGLHYLKADFNQPLEFPFSIPESYHEVQ
jgi:hypothetical protein